MHTALEFSLPGGCKGGGDGVAEDLTSLLRCSYSTDLTLTKMYAIDPLIACTAIIMEANLVHIWELCQKKYKAKYLVAIYGNY